MQVSHLLLSGRKRDYEGSGVFQGTINDGGPPRAGARFHHFNYGAVKRSIEWQSIHQRGIL